jgi:hypothetical protein
MLSILAACDGSDPTGPPDGGISPPVSFAIETDPTLSPDGRYVYYIRTDTMFLDRSGIYRANSADAIRSPVLTGTDFSSPSVSPSGDSVAFIRNGQVWFYRPSDGRTLASGIDFPASSVLYIDGQTILLNTSVSSLSQWDLADGSELRNWAGRNPSLVGPNTIVYLQSGGTDRENVIECNFGSQIDIILETISTSLGINPPFWPDLGSGGDYLVFTLGSGAGEYKVIVTRPATTSGRDTVATASAPKAIFLPDGRIVYTGEDGRLWQTSVTGSSHLPFTATADPD